MFDITAFYILVAAIGLFQVHVYWVVLAIATGWWLDWCGLNHTRLADKIDEVINGCSGWFFLFTIASAVYNFFLIIGARQMYKQGREDWGDIFYMGTVKFSDWIVGFAGGWITFLALFVAFSFFVRANSAKFLKLSEKWGEL